MGAGALHAVSQAPHALQRRRTWRWDAWIISSLGGGAKIRTLSACAITWKHHQQLPRTYNWPTLNNSTLHWGPNYPGFLPWHPGWSHFILSLRCPSLPCRCPMMLPLSFSCADLASQRAASWLGHCTMVRGRKLHWKQNKYYIYIYIFIYLSMFFIFIYLFVI